MQILIGADLVPVQSNSSYFAEGNTKAIVSEELLDILESADFRIFNLETPLCDARSPIMKCGPNLSAPTNTVNGYKALHADLLTLANNHILDQDEQGLISTIETLTGAGISYVGAGKNLTEAEKPFLFSFAGKRIGVYACAEHEYSIATDDTWGANPFDPLLSLDQISKIRQTVDYLIVLYHGGKEQYRYPSPNLQKVCRRIAEKGANLVICQHSHCVGCEEKYNGSTIVYGQGNFNFDNHDNQYWNSGLLVSVDSSLAVSYIPLQKDGCRVRMADEASSILSDFAKRSEEIKKHGFVQEHYQKFAMSNLDNYLSSTVLPKSFLSKVLNKLTAGRYLKKKRNTPTTQRRLQRTDNYMRCEAHRELFLCGLEEIRKRPQ